MHQRRFFHQSNTGKASGSPSLAGNWNTMTRPCYIAGTIAKLCSIVFNGESITKCVKTHKSTSLLIGEMGYRLNIRHAQGSEYGSTPDNFKNNGNKRNSICQLIFIIFGFLNLNYHCLQMLVYGPHLSPKQSEHNSKWMGGPRDSIGSWVIKGPGTPLDTMSEG